LRGADPQEDESGQQEEVGRRPRRATVGQAERDEVRDAAEDRELAHVAERSADDHAGSEREQARAGAGDQDQRQHRGRHDGVPRAIGVEHELVGPQLVQRPRLRRPVDVGQHERHRRDV
jgi:hypothetical protein